MRTILLAVCLLSGCATAAKVRDKGMDTIGSGLELASDGYHGLCTQEMRAIVERVSPDKASKLDQACAKIKLGVGIAIKSYNEVNEVLK